MISYHAKEFESAEPRAHPWSRAVSDESQVYIDFKANPKAIRTSIEDLQVYSKEEFAEEFYSLLEWINGPESLLESNDCAFRGVVENITDKQFHYPKKCQGRVMILFRDLAENCQPKSMEWVACNIDEIVKRIKPNFRAGAIGYSRMPTVYKELGNRPDDGAKGEQVMLSFFAYGKNERGCYENMKKVIECAHSALSKINKKIKAGEVDALYG